MCIYPGDAGRGVRRGQGRCSVSPASASARFTVRAVVSGEAATRQLLVTTRLCSRSDINPRCQADPAAQRHGLLTDAHPDCGRGWAVRPRPGLADLGRKPRVAADLLAGERPAADSTWDLMLAKRQGDLYAVWAAAIPRTITRVAGCAATLGWGPSWARQVSVVGLAVVCLHAGGKTLDELTDDDITSCTGRSRRGAVAVPDAAGAQHGPGVRAAPCLLTSCGSATGHRGSRADRPRPIEELLTADVPQPEIRQGRVGATSRWGGTAATGHPGVCARTA